MDASALLDDLRSWGVKVLAVDGGIDDDAHRANSPIQLHSAKFGMKHHPTRGSDDKQQTSPAGQASPNSPQQT